MKPDFINSFLAKNPNLASVIQNAAQNVSAGSGQVGVQQSGSIFGTQKPQISPDIQKLLDETDALIAKADETIARAKAQLGDVGEEAPAVEEKPDAQQPAKAEIPAEGEYTDETYGKYTIKHNSDGGYTKTWENGSINNYDKDGRETGGVGVSSDFPDGLKYRVVYKKDGSYEKRFADSAKLCYDAQGREIHYEDPTGREWCNRTYNDDGSSVETWNNGSVDYIGKDGKETGGKLANGITYTITYDNEGNKTYTLSDGTIATVDKDGKLIKERS